MLYIVETGEYYIDQEYGYERDYYLVDAPNKKQAMWAAWRHAKETCSEWWRRSDRYEHPLKGATATEAPEEDPLNWYNFLGYTPSPTKI